MLKHMMYLLILHAYGINNEKRTEDVLNRSVRITTGGWKMIITQLFMLKSKQSVDYLRFK